MHDDDRPEVSTRSAKRAVTLIESLRLYLDDDITQEDFHEAVTIAEDFAMDEENRADDEVRAFKQGGYDLAAMSAHGRYLGLLIKYLKGGHILYSKQYGWMTKMALTSEAWGQKLTAALDALAACDTEEN